MVQPNDVPMVKITSVDYNGPKDHEARVEENVYPLPVHLLSEGKITAERLEVRLSLLLAQAHIAGYDIEVGKISNPKLGMGGYIPHVTVRPNFAKARERMAQLAAPAEAVDTTPSTTGSPEERKQYFTLPSYVTERKPAVTGTYVPTGTSPLHDE